MLVKYSFMMIKLPFINTLSFILICLCFINIVRADVLPKPVVIGPEQVQDWWKAGQHFVSQSKVISQPQSRAKNIILFIGDGMGVSTVTAARILAGQLAGKTGEENSLSFETFPHLALSKTYSWDQQTPDSAPTMTAMVTGYKAREGMLSVNQNTARFECDAQRVEQNRLETLLEQAAVAGKSTGIISTARLTHATPAANYAHTPYRDWEADSLMPENCGVKDIARQFIELKSAVFDSLKVVLAGGRGPFMPQTQADIEYPEKSGLRRDGRDLIAEWQLRQSNVKHKAQYIWNQAEFDGVNPQATDYILGLFEPSHMQYEADRVQDKAGEPSLSEMTEKAIALLQKNKQGYFLQIEAGRIDHAHHEGNAQRALLDTIALSAAVKKAVERTNPNDTLIIVTADHSHVFTIAGYPHRGNSILGLVKAVPKIDGNPVVADVDLHNKPYTTLGYTNGPGAKQHTEAGTARRDLSMVNTTLLDYKQEAHIELEKETHGGEDVAIYGYGAGSQLIHGVMEQNWIYHVMREAFGF